MKKEKEIKKIIKDLNEIHKKIESKNLKLITVDQQVFVVNKDEDFVWGDFFGQNRKREDIICNYGTKLIAADYNG